MSKAVLLPFTGKKAKRFEKALELAIKNYDIDKKKEDEYMESIRKDLIKPNGRFAKYINSNEKLKENHNEDS